MINYNLMFKINGKKYRYVCNNLKKCKRFSKKLTKLNVKNSIGYYNPKDWGELN
jgi:hypothetical protein